MNEVEAARQRIGLSVIDLWIGYVALGGTRTAFDLVTVLGAEYVDIPDYDVLAQTLNEGFSDKGIDHRLEYQFDPGESSAGILELG